MGKRWGHRERLKGFCGLGVVLGLAGAGATVANAASGPALALTGASLAAWEAVGLWLTATYGTASGDHR
ncbi:hypothetical protein OG552_16745 [Streptomyces sp. NBC_01476]|uniref:hypothetical protein n=1 Tax=Streptomyces sp. NBC_01476 TaxID=2903881 RepID=UPI002E334AD0|nr:hypothetical protein [Streptomyces sp. NBC_01476]